MPLRLVLVEDHQALREGLELLLGREGIEVLGTAGSATEGRDLVERVNPTGEQANTRVHAIAIALREGFISAPTGSS